MLSQFRCVYFSVIALVIACTPVLINTIIDHPLGRGICFDHAWSNFHFFLGGGHSSASIDFFMNYVFSQYVCCYQSFKVFQSSKFKVWKFQKFQSFQSFKVTMYVFKKVFDLLTLNVISVCLFAAQIFLHYQLSSTQWLVLIFNNLIVMHHKPPYIQNNDMFRPYTCSEPVAHSLFPCCHYTWRRKGIEES